MKLHLTKGLLVALMSAAVQTMAAEVNISSLDETGAILTVPESVTLNAEDTLVVDKGIGFTLGQDITVANLNINSEFNLRPGNYTLTVTDTVAVAAKFGLYDDFTAKVSMGSGSIVIGGNYYTGTGPGCLTLVSGSSLTGGSISVSGGSTLNMGTYRTSTDGLSSVAIEAGTSTLGSGNGYVVSTTGYATSSLITTGTTLTMSAGSNVVIGNTTYVVDADGVMATYDKTNFYVKSGNVVASNSTVDSSSTVIVTDGGRADITADLDADITITGDGEGSKGSYKGAISLGSGVSVNGLLTVTSEGADIANYQTNYLKGGLQLDGDMTIGKTAGYSGNLKIDSAVTGTGDIELAKGTLTLTSNATVSEDVAITISGGVLDLSDALTLTLEGLDLAAGTTIKLGKNTRINFTDYLMIDSGVIFDVSSWCDYDSFNPYELFTYTGSGTFDASGITTGFVTIKTNTGDNEKAYLTVADGKVTLVPEPTTATLSLLALAGLCARRRRK